MNVWLHFPWGRLEKWNWPSFSGKQNRNGHFFWPVHSALGENQPGGKNKKKQHNTSAVRHFPRKSMDVLKWTPSNLNLLVSSWCPLLRVRRFRPRLTSWCPGLGPPSRPDRVRTRSLDLRSAAAAGGPCEGPAPGRRGAPQKAQALPGARQLPGLLRRPGA